MPPSSEGPPDLFSSSISIFFFFWWNLLFHKSGQESPVSLLLFTDEVRGRSTPSRKERPRRYFIPWTAHSCLTLPLIKLPPLRPFTSEDPRGQRLICEDTRPSGKGVRYPLQEPPSSGQWLMKPALWQVQMSGPGLFWGSLSNANDTNSGCLSRVNARFYYRYHHSELLRTG